MPEMLSDLGCCHTTQRDNTRGHSFRDLITRKLVNEGNLCIVSIRCRNKNMK